VRVQHAARLAPRSYVAGLSAFHFLRDEIAEALEYAERALITIAGLGSARAAKFTLSKSFDAITVQGEIIEGDEDKLRSALVAVQSSRRDPTKNLEIYLASPGGRVVVSPENMNGWSFSDDQADTACTEQDDGEKAPVSGHGGSGYSSRATCANNSGLTTARPTGV